MRSKKLWKSIGISLIVLMIVFILGISIAHAVVFKRCEYKGYNSDYYLLYDDIDQERYPREKLDILSGNNILAGYLYEVEASKGLIVISPGHRDASDIKLYEIMYFVDNGWSVLCYDYTGCYASDGTSMKGYTQCIYDLDAVLSYIEDEERFKDMPVMLFGHSLGAYATAGVLQFNHNVKAAVVASGFNTPSEQWTYSIERYTGVGHYILKPFTELFINLKYGKDKDLSAVDGINAVDIPILIISGTNDEFYGGESPIYKQRENIFNKNAEFLYMTEENHNGHYDYFLTDKALDYQKQIHNSSEIDKFLYMEHDVKFMDSLEQFYMDCLP